METPAKRLKFARQLRGMNQVRLAAAAGVATGTVGNIEAGTRGIDGSALKLAKALNVDPNWLATGEGPSPDTETHQDQLVAEQEPQPEGIRQTIDRLGELLRLVDERTRDVIAEMLLRYAKNPDDGEKLASVIEMLLKDVQRNQSSENKPTIRPRFKKFDMNRLHQKREDRM